MITASGSLVMGVSQARSRPLDGGLFPDSARRVGIRQAMIIT